MLIGQYLNFYMPWAGDEFFDKYSVIAETRCGFAHGGGISAFYIFSRMGDPHAFAAAAGTGFNHHRITNIIGNLYRFGGCFNNPHMPGYSADPGGLGQFF